MEWKTSWLPLKTAPASLMEACGGRQRNRGKRDFLLVHFLTCSAYDCRVPNMCTLVIFPLCSRPAFIRSSRNTRRRRRWWLTMSLAVLVGVTRSLAGGEREQKKVVSAKNVHNRDYRAEFANVASLGCGWGKIWAIKLGCTRRRSCVSALNLSLRRRRELTISQRATLGTCTFLFAFISGNWTNESNEA